MGHPETRRAFPWREILILLLFVLLILQLSPDLANNLLDPAMSAILSALDFRNWNLITWLIVQAIALVALVVIKVKYFS